MNQHPESETSHEADTARRGRLARLCLYLLLAALSVRGFWDAGQYTGGHHLAYGDGVTTLPPQEMVFLLWYLVFGSLAVSFAALALLQTGIPDALASALRKATARPWLTIGVACGLLLVLTLGIRFQLLQNAPITDDESTYRFIAQTLLDGRVVTPTPEAVPEADYAFLDYRFVLHNTAGWYGKYPIGHPLLLAIGEGVGARFLVVPLLSCLSLVLTWAIGRRFFGDLEAVLGAGLLVVSPQFVFTGATDLSQPACGAFMLLGLWAMLRMEESEASGSWRWALLGGGAWGFGILVRPLPGVLFLAVVALAFLVGGLRTPDGLGGSWREHGARRWKLLLVAALPVVLCGLILLWVNGQQTGEALTTGYHEQHGGLGLLDNRGGRMAVSVGGGLLRQNFWLFGWPLSLLFVPFARLRRDDGAAASPWVSRAWYAWAFWGLILAGYGYRVLVPKTVVATTGPIYLAEVVPLLALASGAGLLRLGRWLDGVTHSDGNVGTRAVWATAAAGTLVATLSFLPVNLSEIGASVRTWHRVYDRLMLEQLQAPESQIEPALVFTYFLVHPQNHVSWAYYAPPPSPACLDPERDCPDPVVFAAGPKNVSEFRAALDFWQRHFPERSAWGFLAFADGTHSLRRLQPNSAPWPELLQQPRSQQPRSQQPRSQQRAPMPGSGVLRPGAASGMER